MFQSTFPRGERQVSGSSKDFPYIVSIHVPTRGTTISCRLSAASGLFQSTFPRGERQAFRKNGGIIQMFQSTFPRGERLPANQREVYPPCFNPRSHEGNDAEAIQYIADNWGFNPRSHEGNDYAFALNKADAIKFQSTFPRGERLCYILRF